MNVRGLCTRCDRDTLRNFDWFMDKICLAGGYNQWLARVKWTCRYQSHPKLAVHSELAAGEDDFLRREELLELSARAREKGIVLIPTLGFWGYNPITAVYPELAENKAAPKAYCPRNPKTQAMVKDMLDEIIDLLHPQYVHVGLDEINEDHMPYDNYRIRDQIGLCPLCRMDSPADIFAKEVNRLNQYIKGKGCAMMMWGDQLLNPPDFFEVYKRDANYGDETYQAIDSMDRDIIICDWHYANNKAYPSIDYFMKHGFKVLGCPSVYDRDNITGFTDYVRCKGKHDRLPGMIMTFWGKMSLRSESKDDYQYGFIDDKNTVDMLLLAGNYFRKNDDRH